MNRLTVALSKEAACLDSMTASLVGPALKILQNLLLNGAPVDGHGALLIMALF